MHTPIYGFKEFVSGLATLLEGASLAFDIQKCLKFQKYIMVVLKLWSWI